MRDLSTLSCQLGQSVTRKSGTGLALHSLCLIPADWSGEHVRGRSSRPSIARTNHKVIWEIENLLVLSAEICPGSTESFRSSRQFRTKLDASKLLDVAPSASFTFNCVRCCQAEPLCAIRLAFDRVLECSPSCGSKTPLVVFQTTEAALTRPLRQCPD